MIFGHQARLLFEWSGLKWQIDNLTLCFYSLFCNIHLDSNYASDVCLEPIFWFVDNFAKFLGPFFVACVSILMFAVIFIAYYIGLPYWWNKNPWAAVLLVIFGNWLKINVLFNYYMGVVTSPGYPPKGDLVPEAVSICKKCIAPKPPRTHHCSICNRCILKMDHHCPWLNNCVGHFNHRYFYMYMVFISMSTLFIIIFGLEIAYKEVWLSDTGDEDLVGHPVKFNESEVIPVPEWDNTTQEFLPLDPPNTLPYWRRKAIIFMALICSGAFVALSWLSSWHGKQISRGETSIEAHINSAQAAKLRLINQAYVNPYDFGPIENWRIFFAVGEGRSWLCIFYPSPHPPFGNGLTWPLAHFSKFKRE